MTEENNKKENRNAYHRKRYKLNVEAERKRNKEKYHKHKKLFSELSEEEKRLKREKNRLNYEKWRIRQGKNPPQRDYVIPRENLKPPIHKEIKKENSMKKLRLPSRITHKYVSEVLRKFPKSRLCNILISKWTLAELTEFELLEEEFNKSAN